MTSSNQVAPARTAVPMASLAAVRGELMSPRMWMALLGAYYLWHALARAWASPCVELDEAEQVVFAQVFGWSYGSALPLYTWLQIASFKLLGQSVLGLSLLKNALLFGLMAGIYGAARSITGSHKAGLVATVCVLLTPQIVWESQRDLTHSVLACAIVAGWFWCIVRAHQERHWRWYLLLGCLSSAGALSKFNFSVMALCTVAAGLMMPGFRGTLLNRKFLWTAGIVGVTAFVWWHGYSSQDGGLSEAAQRMGVGRSRAWAELAGLGVWRLVVGALASCIVPAAVLVLLLRGKARHAVSAAPTPVRPWLALMLRAWCIMGVTAAIAIPLMGIQGFHQRWLQPLLMTFPVFAAVAVGHLVDESAARRLTRIGMVVMLLVGVLLPARTVLNWGKDEPYGRPYPALAAQLRTRIAQGTFLATDNTLLGGNLRLALQHVPVVTPGIAHLFSSRGSHCAAVWDMAKGEAPPKVLTEWAARQPKAKATPWEPIVLTAAYPGNPNRERRIGLVWLW